MSQSETSTLSSSVVTSEDLLDAANDASGQARNMWLFFLGLLTYLIVTLAGTTHKNLLLNDPVKLPFLNVDIPLFSFFIYGPVVILAFHLAILIQHAMLSYKLFRFTETLNDEGSHRQGSDLRRSRLHPYIVSQLIAGPERGALMGFLIRLMSWFSLVALPVMTLLYFQIAFLPYHSIEATYWHRIAVLIDCLILFSLWPYMRPATKREAKSKIRSEKRTSGWPWRVTAFGFGFGGSATLALLLFSWFVATIPDACFYKNEQRGMNILCLDSIMAKFEPWNVTLKSGSQERKVFWLTAKLFEGPPDQVTGRPTSIWSRNIVLTDSDLVPEKKFNPGEVSLSLRGRDLRYAVLDRSDLHRVDFTGVDLRGASLKETRLEEAKFCLPLKVFPRTCSQFSGADLKEANLMGVDFWGAKLSGAQLAFVRLDGADFRNAELEGANLSFAELKGADLSLANLKGAKLNYAKLQRAKFDEAELQKAEFSSANLQGANFNNALMAGANLSAANLQAAELNEAQLKGANLSEAKLEGANLRNADLRGSDLTEASLKGTDMKFVRIWGATFPGSKTSLELADLTNLSTAGLTSEEQKELAEALKALENDKLRKDLEKKMESAGLLEDASDENWPTKTEWRAKLDEFNNRDPEGYARKIVSFWISLSCGTPEISESVADRLARKENGLDHIGMARQLTLRTCDSALVLKASAKESLCRMARWPLAARKDTICE